MELILVILATLLFVVFLATIGVSLFYFGLFEDVRINVGSSPIPFTGQTLAYKLARGPYKKSGHLFTEMTGDLVRLITDKNSDTLKTIGFYYDDPVETQESRLRYAVGVIFPNEGEDGWTKDKIADLKTGLLSKDYKITTLPKIDHVVYTTFPFRSAMSIVIAVKRVYPIIRAYVSRHNLCAHPALEVYTPELIYFILPLSKQDHFYLFDSDDEEACLPDPASEHSVYSSSSCSEDDDGSGSKGSGDIPQVEGRLRKRNVKEAETEPSKLIDRKDSLSSTQNSTSSFEEINASDHFDKDK